MPRPTKRNPRPIVAWPGTRLRKPADFGASRAGSTVSEPMIAVATTRIVARAMPENTPLPARNMPLIAAMTVRPETSTARPEVAAAISIASTLPAPRAQLLALTGDVEDRVVDADGEADQQDDRLRRRR